MELPVYWPNSTLWVKGGRETPPKLIITKKKLGETEKNSLKERKQCFLLANQLINSFTFWLAVNLV